VVITYEQCDISLILNVYIHLFLIEFNSDRPSYVDIYISSIVPNIKCSTKCFRKNNDLSSSFQMATPHKPNWKLIGSWWITFKWSCKKLRASEVVVDSLRSCSLAGFGIKSAKRLYLVINELKYYLVAWLKGSWSWSIWLWRAAL
jgi:hypothetical protein